MIRLRIEPQSSEAFPNGLVWYDNGQAVGRVIIEQEVVSDVKDHPHYGQITSYRWAPVEVE